MDGVAAVRAALLDHPDMIDAVPGDRIVAGDLPEGTTLNAISLESVSKVDRNIAAPGGMRHVRERVQLTVHARNYVEQKAVMRAVRRAAPDQIDIEVPGIEAVTIHTQPSGPDFRIPGASIWCGVQDFLVTYLEPR
jgi:hypothetical protein